MIAYLSQSCRLRVIRPRQIRSVSTDITRAKIVNPVTAPLTDIVLVNQFNQTTKSSVSTTCR